MSTYFPRKEDIRKKWFLVDAEGQVLGRMSTQIADLLHGKNNAEYSSHVDTGAHVVVINASKVILTGKKLEQKLYFRHSGWPGGFKQISAVELKRKFPERLIMHAVWGMLPKNKLGRALLKKLKVYPGEEHPHEAQQPEPVHLEE